MTLFGLAVGSFVNLNVDRIPAGRSIVLPGSFCDRCERSLSWIDLVPLLSYLWLRGKCRFCGAAIPLRNFVLEVITGGMFALVTYRFGLGGVGGVILAYGTLLICISAIDMEHTIIPDKLVLPGIVLAFAAAPFGPVGEDRGLLDTYIRIVAGGGVGLGSMLLIYMMALAAYRSSGGFGFGDVKLGLLIGLVVGFPNILISVYFAFISGGIVAMLLLALKLRGRKDAIPYGPFLAAGAMLTLLAARGAGWYVDWLR